MTTTESMPALLEAYFADLDRALIGADARERADTIQAMREHATEMLARYGSSEETAERVIADLGPVDQVAAAATSAPVAARSWVDIWLLAGSIASLALYVVPLVPIVMLAWAIVRMRSNIGNRALQRAALWVSALSVVLSTGLWVSHFVHAL